VDQIRRHLKKHVTLPLYHYPTLTRQQIDKPWRVSDKLKPSCVKIKQVYLYDIFRKRRRIDFRIVRVGQYFTYMDYMKSYILRTHFKMYLPPVRIELTTPGLQDQCSATELKRLP
jgi:hypothetical protein